MTAHRTASISLLPGQLENTVRRAMVAVLLPPLGPHPIISAFIRPPNCRYRCRPRSQFPSLHGRWLGAPLATVPIKWRVKSEPTRAVDHRGSSACFGVAHWPVGHGDARFWLDSRVSIRRMRHNLCFAIPPFANLPIYRWNLFHSVRTLSCFFRWSRLRCS